MDQLVDVGIFADRGLNSHQPCIGAIQRQKFRMRSLLDQSTLVEHQNPVSVSKRRESVRDRQGGTTTYEDFKSFLNALFGLGVDVARRLIEHKNLRIIQQGPCNRESLLFTS